MAVGDAIKKVVELYENYGKSTIPKDKVDEIKQVINDEAGTIEETIRGYTEKLIELKRRLEEFRREEANIKAAIRDLDEERKRIILEAIKTKEHVINGISEGESIAWNIKNGTGRIYGTIVAKLKTETTPPDELDVYHKAVELLKTKYPKVMKEFEKTVQELMVSEELVEKNLELIIAGIFPEIKGIRSLTKENYEFLKKTGIDNLLIEGIGDLWNKFKDVVLKTVGYIKTALGKVFRLSKEAVEFAADAETIAKQIES